MPAPGWNAANGVERAAVKAEIALLMDCCHRSVISFVSSLVAACVLLHALHAIYSSTSERFLEISDNIRKFKIHHHCYYMEILNIIIQYSRKIHEYLEVFSDALFGHVVAIAAVDAASSKA